MTTQQSVEEIVQDLPKIFGRVTVAYDNPMSPLKAVIPAITTYGTARYEEGVKAERERVREWIENGMSYNGEALASNDTRRGYDSARAEVVLFLSDNTK